MSSMDEKISKIISKLGHTLGANANLFGPTSEGEEKYEDYDDAVKTLETLNSILKTIDNLTWSTRLEELVGAVKMFIVFYDRVKQRDKKTGCEERTILKGLRLSSLACETLGKICELLDGPKDGYSFFSAFVLKQSHCNFSLVDLFRLEHEDPEQRTSLYIAYNSVFQVLGKAVDKSKTILSFAESKNVQNHPATYTAFSMIMAFALEDLLKTLIGVIEKNVLRVDIMMLCSVLVQLAEACPFHRLHLSVFKTLVEFVSSQLQSRPLKISRQDLLKLANICVNQKGFSAQDLYPLFEPEILSHVGKIPPNYNQDLPPQQQEPLTASRIIIKSIQYLNYWMTAATLESENIIGSTELVLLDFQLITSLTKNYFTTFRSDSLLCLNSSIYILSVMPHFIKQYAEDTGSSPSALSSSSKPVSSKTKEIFDMKMSVVSQALQFMVELALAVSRHIDESEQVDEDFVTRFMQQWDLFFDIAPDLMNNDVLLVCKGVADCFAAFGPSLFDRISPSRQKFCIVSVLGWCRDDRSNVRSKGGRCLAHLVIYRLLAEDEYFLLDALDVMEENLKGRGLNTRSSFAWCLGNYTESLLTFHKGKMPPNFRQEDVVRIGKLCFKLAADRAKIRYNAHRAIGNLLGWCPLDFLTTKARDDFITESMGTLLKQIGSGNDYKARWNASHAIGTAFENEALLVAHPRILPNTLKHIAKVVHKSENYKERIQCVITLTRLQQRQFYENLFFLIWQRIFEALDVPEELQPTELNQVEKLKVEVCLGVCHLTTLLEKNDIPELETVMANNLNTLQDAVNFSIRTMIPERVQEINNAREHLRTLCKTESFNSGEREILGQLIKVFTIEDFQEFC